MRYSYSQVVLQEVPSEISLALSISGCQKGCDGCHSPETWNTNFGKEINTNKLGELIEENKYVTCVLFYGGEWALSSLELLIKEVKSKNKKVALYSGEHLSYFTDNFIHSLDYLKVGEYIKELGGLQSPNTNQCLYRIKDGNLIKLNMS